MKKAPMGRAPGEIDPITGGDPSSWDPQERLPLEYIHKDLFTFDDVEYFEVNDDDIAFD